MLRLTALATLNILLANAAGPECPADPPNTYQNTDLLPTYSSVTTIEVKKCWGSPFMAPVYGGGRYCSVRINGISQCVQVADSNCYFTPEYIESNLPSLQILSATDAECNNFALCGAVTCPVEKKRAACP